jgi:hypothetical protein
MSAPPRAHPAPARRTGASRDVHVHVRSLVSLVVSGTLVLAVACDRGDKKGQNAACTRDTECGRDFWCQEGLCRELPPAPVVTVIQPTSGSFAGREVDLQLAIASGVPLEAVEISVDRGPPTRLTAEPWRTPIRFEVEGDHEIVIDARDVRGRQPRTSVPVKADFAAPELNLLEPSGDTSGRSSITFLVDATDTVGVASARAVVRRGAAPVADLGTVTAPPYSFVWHAGWFAPGAYEVELTAVDLAGKVAALTVPVVRTGGPGAACNSAAACASGFCADGACCNETCAGPCQSCALPGAVGVCRPVVSRDDPAVCDGAMTCSEQARCVARAPGPGKYPGCSKSETLLIDAALADVRRLLDGDEPRRRVIRCLGDGLLWTPPPLQGLGERSPENTLQDARNVRVQTARCAELGAPDRRDGLVFDREEGRAVIDRDELLGQQGGDVAATILHELTHAVGHSHPPGWAGAEAELAVCRQLDRCVRQVLAGATEARPAPPLRADFGVETTLAPMATDTGEPEGTVACAGGAVAEGLHGHTAEYVHAVGLLCQVGETRPFGPTVGTPFSQRCPPGEVLVGVAAQAGGWLDAVGAVCAPSAAWISSDPPAPPPTRLPLYGGPGGNDSSRICPRGLAVKALRARVRTEVDRLDVVCQSLRHPAPLEETTLERLGGPGDWRAHVACQGRAVVVALPVSTSPDLGLVRLAGVCREVTHAEAAGATLGPRRHAVYTRGGAGPGRPDGNACPDGGALVGIRAGVRRWLRSVQAICAADAAAWIAGRTADVVLGPVLGDGTPADAESRCPAQTVVTGWHVGSGAAIDSVTLVCRRF